MSGKSTFGPRELDPAETLTPGQAAAQNATIGFLPTYRSEITTPSGGRSHLGLTIGQRIEDFELLRLLGEGAFGQVFLARQMSLDRQVAVKATANRGSEARTLASLEHDHIVQVFAEIVIAERDLRLLCMQYVPGTTLDKLIGSMAKRPRTQWSGQTLLDALDQMNTQPTPFHPAALRDRDTLGNSDHVEAACWYGARLAEALDYAHARGILHRDVKPANILVNSYGRPFLADFNLAIQSEHPGDTIYGGTLAYMAPEHLDAFNPAMATTWDAVDARADLYSLGVVVYEMLTTRRPFLSKPPEGDIGESLRRMAEQRREEPPAPRVEVPTLPECIDHTIRRCLHPEPPRRYQNGAELAQALDGGRELYRIQKELPPPGPITRAALRRPFLCFIVLLLLPHLLGSVVNIWYNQLEIVSKLDPAQRQAFDWILLAYNLVVYPATLWWMLRLVMPVVRVWQRLRGGEAITAGEVNYARRRVLAWPLWAVGLACIGWFPGGILFPLGIHLAAGPLPAEAFGHFLTSFTISGLIALTYSYFAVQYMVLRVLYPRLWVDPRSVADTIALEVAPVGRRLRLFQVLAGVIPLAGAVLMVGVGAEASSDRGFRALVCALIILGMGGFGIAVVVHTLLAQTIEALTSTRRRGGNVHSTMWHTPPSSV